MSFLRQILLLCLVTAVAGGAYWVWETYIAEQGGADAAQTDATRTGARRGGAQGVEVAKAVMVDFADRIEAVGTTRARQSVEIVPLASGRVAGISFEAGAAIKAGDVMIRLDDDIERADLVEAEAKLARAASTLARTSALRKKKAVSEAALTKAIAERAIAGAAVGRARRKLADRTVTAPFDGRTGLRQIDIGARVDTDTMITTLDDLSEAEIEFSVPEILFGRLGPGAAVQATAAAFPGQIFEGTVKIVDSRVDPVSRAFRVRAGLPNPDGLLPAGMFMYLEAVTGRRKALVVPEESVIAEGAGAFVYVIIDEKAVRRSVALGQRRVGEVEITAGLVEGEIVATAGTQRLRDGKAVRIIGGTTTAPAVETQKGAAG